MEKMKEHFRHCLLYEYQFIHSARQATQNICGAIGPRSVSHATTSRWFDALMKETTVCVTRVGLQRRAVLASSTNQYHSDC